MLKRFTYNILGSKTLCMHVICQVLGFGEYIEEVYAAYEQHKIETMVIVCLLAPCLRLAFCNVSLLETEL